MAHEEETRKPAAEMLLALAAVNSICEGTDAGDMSGGRQTEKRRPPIREGADARNLPRRAL